MQKQNKITVKIFENTKNLPKLNSFDAINKFDIEFPHIWDFKGNNLHNQFKIIKNSFGKPLVVQTIHKNNYFNLNISHTPNITAIATSNLPFLGLDIEDISLPKKYPASIIKKIFTVNPPDIEEWENPFVKKSFYKIWTKNEALFKALGVGLYFPLGIITFLENTIIIKNEDLFKNEMKKVLLLTVNIPENTITSIIDLMYYILTSGNFKIKTFDVNEHIVGSLAYYNSSDKIDIDFQGLIGI